MAFLQACARKNNLTGGAFYVKLKAEHRCRKKEKL